MNVIFIALDTCRADHLSAYGYHRRTTPNLEQLAAQGVRFDWCIAQNNATQPSYTTMYAGQHPVTHNIVAHSGHVWLDDSVALLPEILRRHGVITAAVDDLYEMKRWFARGYDYYVNPAGARKPHRLVTADDINERALPLLRHLAAHRGRDFFLFLHYWDSHTRYQPPPPFDTLYYDGDPRDPAKHSLDPLRGTYFGDVVFKGWLDDITDAEYITALYDGCLSYADDRVGQVLHELSSLGLDRDTIVLVTGDHGESMTEHNIFFDHHGLYDPTLHVPLIVRAPGRLPAAAQVRPMVRHIDIVPTLLDLLGLPPHEQADGSSLVPLVEGRARSHVEMVVTTECSWQCTWGLRTDRWKYLRAVYPGMHGAPPQELYDLQADHGETRNLADEMPATRDELDARLQSWIDEQLRRLGRSEDPLKAQGPSLARRWQEWERERGGVEALREDLR